MGVTSLGMGFYIGAFVIYLLTHIGIGFAAMEYKRRIFENGATAIDETCKTLWFFNKWWPAIYLIFLLVVLYGIK